MSIRNLDRLHRNLAKLADVDLTQGLARGALHVVREAKEIVPVDTGLLRSSIQSKVSKEEATVGTNVEYAANVEFGLGQRPQPYLTPAFHNNTDNIKKEIKADLDRQIKGIFK